MSSISCYRPLTTMLALVFLLWMVQKGQKNQMRFYPLLVLEHLIFIFAKNQEIHQHKLSVHF